MIKIENLNKDYVGFESISDRLIHSLSFGFLGGRKKFRALENINLKINNNEIFGIIGRNGAGKSTLLKTLSGVSLYETGSIQKTGSIRAILELGVGFNPELSGSENIYYNGLVIGYLPEEMQRLKQEIFNFAGLTGFEDIPLKNYSTGMIMRLAFALSTARRPDNLIIDEALAVGDASFQNKCLEKFKEFKELGSSIIVVSHDLNLMQSICDRICVLEKGKIYFIGDPISAIKEYIQLLAIHSRENSISINGEFIEIEKIELLSNKIEKKIFATSEKIELILKMKIKQNIPDLTVGFHIDDSKGIRVFGTNSYHHKLNIKNLCPEQNLVVKFNFPLNISMGKYSLGIALHEGDNHTKNCYLWKDGLIDFEVERLGVPKFDGIAYLETNSEYEIL